MKTKKCLQYLFALILFSLFHFFTKAQESGTTISASTYSLYSSGNDLPFWFTSNQQGIFEHANNSFNIADVSINKNFNSEKKWDYSYGARAIYAKGENTYHQFNEWYTGISYKSFYLKAGAFPEETIYGGLSSTNGNIDWSNNARPIPRIRLSTNKFIPLPFGKNSNFWKDVNFKLVYDEGILNDNRYVKNTHLHHKFLQLKKHFGSHVSVTFGIEDYAMWGGTSPEYGKMPGVKSYLRYILLLPGSKNGSKSEEFYVAGNHFGNYSLEIKIQLPKGTLTWYENAPFDHSPTFIQTFMDNLHGLFYQSNSKDMISEIILEFMNTCNQAGNRWTDGNGNVQSNYELYFNHGIYKSGYSFHNRMIASPFFTPLIIKDGISYGTGNNRVALVHLGINGYLSSRIKWKSFFSVSFNHGTYGQAYNVIIPGFFDHPYMQFSILGELTYEFPKSGLNISLVCTGDVGEALREDQIGAMFKIGKSFSLDFKK